MKAQLVLGLVIVVCVAGCATTQDKSLLTQLQYRLGDLERELSVKDEKIQDLEADIKGLSYELQQVRTRARGQTGSSKMVSRTVRKFSFEDEDDILRVDVPATQVQQALKKAGYYQGNLDGKIGKQTKAAIAQFQKDHELKVDGIVGEQTWTELKSYLKG